MSSLQDPSGIVRGRVLVVDDDRRMASGMAQWLCGQGYHASAAGTAGEALQVLQRSPCDACIVDGLLADAGAIRVVTAARAVSPRTTIILTMPTESPAADPACRADAVLTGPVTDAAVLEALAAGRRRDRVTPLEPASPAPVGLLGSHPAIRSVLDVVARIADTPATILITGESGTGKSLLAREIHAISRRRQGRFVEVACGAVSESLLESELFGHVAGAFTGALGDRPGKFLQADGGTIFLDEIATASPALQVKLLRVLQDLQFEAVGGGTTHAVDTRVILATHEDLAGLVAAGRFRADLFWRINVITIEMPALRDRISDVPQLAVHFLRRAAAQAGREVTGFTPAALDALLGHAWPGNVRELQHAVERATFLGRGPLIELSDLPAAVTARTVSWTAGKDRGGPLKLALATPERQLILDALQRSGWRRDAAAKALGINRTTLYKKLKRLGMDLAVLAPGR
jgi:DNA-binding NtrC family response regulator